MIVLLLTWFFDRISLMQHVLRLSSLWHIGWPWLLLKVRWEEPYVNRISHRDNALVAGHLRDPESDQPLRRVGLPYGPKPRLFQSYIYMKAIKHQSPIVPVERSMSDMMHMLGSPSPAAGTERFDVQRANHSFRRVPLYHCRASPRGSTAMSKRPPSGVRCVFPHRSPSGTYGRVRFSSPPTITNP